MGRHSSLRPNQAPAIPQAPLDDKLPTAAAWAAGEAKASDTVSSRRYGAVAALAAATALSAVAVTTDTGAAPAYAATNAFNAPLQIVTEAPDLRSTISIVADGETIELITENDTYGRALAEAGVFVGPNDIVNVNLSDEIEEGTEVVVQRVTYESVVEEEVVEYDTIRKNDSTLEKGTEKVTTKGQDGVTRTTYRITLIDGEEDSREETINVRASELVDEVISVGTKEPAPEPAPAPAPAPAQTRSAPSAPAPAPAPAPAQPVVVNASGSKGIAQQMVANKGWSNSEFQCLETLWQRESNWNHLAQNPSSGAYGIPQSLPGSKMASHGADWRTNPATQISWGLSYIQGRYGTPCGALNHSYARGWY